ncbi:hypothetical protein [Streptomyces sp. NPDC059894]|uniref:hypothetical protein n=1 Tax=unclassified Streptomyces TaxID=2593676 RepID=UPI00365F9DD7
MLDAAWATCQSAAVGQQPGVVEHIEGSFMSAPGNGDSSDSDALRPLIEMLSREVAELKGSVEEMHKRQERRARWNTLISLFSIALGVTVNFARS